jgi:CubicO group peptidase (beta-lactamase class C family)
MEHVPGSTVSRWLHGYVVSKMSRLNVPGLSLTVMKSGELVEQRAYGYRSLEKSLPATPDTVYEIASITKVFTAVAIMQLVEKGVLSLDDPADKYLPIELRVKDEPVRIWHLLSHTSGIPALGYAEALLSSYFAMSRTWLPYSDPRHVLEWLEKGARHWAIASPGERFFYLNEGFVALGLIIEKVSGLSYADYVERFIVKPLGLQNTTARFEEAQNHPLLATPYDSSQNPPKPMTLPSTIYADGGIYSSSTDLAKFMQALANKGRLGDAEILSKSSVEEMEKPRAKLPTQLFGDDSYGLGTIIYSGFPAGRLVGHSGSVYVYTGYAGYIADKGLSIGVLANADAAPRDIAMAVLAALGGADPEQLPFIKADKLLENLEGVYHGYMGTVKARVERLGDNLVLEMIEPRGGKAVLEPAKPITEMPFDNPIFLLRSGGRVLEVEFRVDPVKGVEMIYERYRLVKAAPLEAVEPKRSTIVLW